MPPAQGNPVHAVNSHPGVVVVDTSLKVVATNGDAIQILTFPDRREKIGDLNNWLTHRVQSYLLDRASPNSNVTKEFRSAKRTYHCRSFRLGPCVSEPGGDGRPAFVIILERKSNGITATAQISRRFALTAREEQVVQLLVEGLTSKEIAIRMKISPNTVKGFIRLIMVKMNVSTRSGIIGKIIEPAE